MQLTKYTHACVRLERDGRALVIDPGIWSEPQALFGAHAVLVTHEHADHLDLLRLAGLGVPVYAPADAKISRLDLVRGVDLHRVTAGDTFTVAGFQVTAVGGRHAFRYDRTPDCANLGYVVEGVYHPGDSVHVPAEQVETVLMPVHGSWLKVAEAVEMVRAIKPRRTFAIHDAMLNERGLDSVKGLLDGDADRAFGYRWLAPLTTVES